jgi:Flp pilus assembly protein TadG
MTRTGVATVELAVLLPFLLLLFVIAVDFSRAFYLSIELANAARTGALYGSFDPTHAVDTTGIQTAAQNDGGDLNTSLLIVTSTTDSTTNPTYVRVTVTYPFQTLTSYLTGFQQMTLSQTVQMPVTPWSPN